MKKPSPELRASLEGLEMGKDNVSGEVAPLMNAGLSPEQIAARLGRKPSQVRADVASLNSVLDGTITVSALTPSARIKTASHVRRLSEMCSPEMVAEQQYLVSLLAELEAAVLSRVGAVPRPGGLR